MWEDTDRGRAEARALLDSLSSHEGMRARIAQIQSCMCDKGSAEKRAPYLFRTYEGVRARITECQSMQPRLLDSEKEGRVAGFLKKILFSKKNNVFLQRFDRR
jgi:hypothetical protein